LEMICNSDRSFVNRDRFSSSRENESPSACVYGTEGGQLLGFCNKLVQECALIRFAGFVQQLLQTIM